MPRPNATEDEFIEIFSSRGPLGTARYFKMAERAVHARRRAIEGRRNITIESPTIRGGYIPPKHYPHRASFNVDNGTVLIGSDAHIWPGPQSTAMRGFIAFCKELKPKAVILNGDVMDCATISRHPPIGWENRPSVKQEIEAAQDQLHEIEKACGRGVRKIWPLGNHDARFETRLATVAPEFAKIKGVHLSDHFPHWEKCWASWINNSVVVKHRWKGGIHATHNNVVGSGVSMVTGHLHSAKVTPYNDYRPETRYGVDTGCLANPDGRQFTDYTEDSPKNWRSAFGVLTFRNGVLLQPELALVHDDRHVDFRGGLIRV